MQHKKLRILLDCDGVLSDFLSSVFDFAERETGVRYQHIDVKTWEVFDSIASHLRHTFDAEAATPGFCMSMKPYAAALKGVKQLQALGEIFVVTSPMDVPNWEKERRDWCMKHFGIDRHHVISASSKHIVQGDMFIDDKPSNIEEWENYQTGKALLWDAPYNQNTNAYHRITSWDDAVIIAKTLLKRKLEHEGK
jgi:5'(3')-deoxyribonucleotidase